MKINEESVAGPATLNLDNFERNIAKEVFEG